MGTVRAVVFDNAGTLWDHEPIREPAIELVHSLHAKGVRLAMLSNTSNIGTSQWLRNNLHQAGILHLFEVVVSSADVGKHKPDWRAFNLVRDFFPNIPPYEILMVGDNKNHDGAARQLGWRFREVSYDNLEQWTKNILTEHEYTKLVAK